MSFNIVDHLDALTHKGRGRYICPVCNGGNLTINKKTGAYKCWSNECESSLIRQAIAPIEDKDDKAPKTKPKTAPKTKPKTAPKLKAKPVFVNLPDVVLATLPGDYDPPQSYRINQQIRTFYQYGDGHQVMRTDFEDGSPKEIKPQYRQDADLGSLAINGKGDRPWNAYKIDEVCANSAGKFALLVEGEKCVESLRSIGFTAFTFNGSGWKDEDFSRAIVRLKEHGIGVIICPDNDEPGQKKADHFLEICAKHNHPALKIDPMDIWERMPDKGDVADWIAVFADNELIDQGFYRQMLNQAIALACNRQPAPAPVAETTTDLKPHQPESRRIHGGYKDLRPRELMDFIENEIGDRLSFDNLLCEILLDDQPLRMGSDLKFWFLDEFGESASKDDLYACLLYKAKQNSFNPVSEYLESCHSKPYRVPIDNISSRYFGTSDPLYDRLVKMWLISAVARVYDPGCQVDHTLILQSSQGKYKSTWFKVLAGQWFSDSVKDIEAKDSLLTLHSSWIIELSELDRLTSKKQAGVLKHFLTQREDIFRKPYGKEVERNPRRALFCGTVNPSRFLVDDENRRFWIIPVDPRIEAIDINLIEKERDGIWASAVDALLAGDLWYPTDDEKFAIANLNKEFVDVDVWQEPIEHWISHRDHVSVYEILYELFSMPTSLMDKRSQMRVAKILDHLGWTQQVRKEIYGKIRRVRLNPLQSDGLLESEDKPTNNIYIDGKVGNVGKDTTVQSFDAYQPTDQPFNEVGSGRGRIDPTPKNEVGQPQIITQTAVYQPTDQRQPIPKKYLDAGFCFHIGDRPYIRDTNMQVEILKYPPVGINFAAKRYLCLMPDGFEDWIEQSSLILI